MTLAHTSWGGAETYGSRKGSRLWRQGERNSTESMYYEYE